MGLRDGSVVGSSVVGVSDGAKDGSSVVGFRDGRKDGAQEGATLKMKRKEKKITSCPVTCRNKGYDGVTLGEVEGDSVVGAFVGT